LPVATKTTISLHEAQARFLDSAALFRAFVGGRGCGKSWIGAYDLLKRARPNRLYMAVGPTYTMMQDSCLRSFVELGQQLQFIMSINRSNPPRVTLGNGAEVLFRSADEPEHLRGPNLSGVWMDEASLTSKDAYDIVIACLREKGEQGWLSATFTPKGRQHWTYEAFGQGRPDTELVHARTRDNPFLPPEFERSLRQQYTSFLAQQELEGLFISDIEGALWRQAWLDASRVHKAPPLVRVVVAIDPAVTHSEASDDTGICVAGQGDDGHYYVLHCRGYQLSPDGWARKALDLYDQHLADRIIAERNNGGEMVESTLRNVRPKAPVSTIVASKGKAVRAEPIAALYEQGRVHHVGTLGQCEEQMCMFPVANEHDDMVDALVYALTDLVERTPGRVRITTNPFYGN
jgi:predicted phage terminase large subunit-like protein